MSLVVSLSMSAAAPSGGAPLAVDSIRSPVDASSSSAVSSPANNNPTTASSSELLPPSAHADPDGPSVLILGGSGFIGRHLLHYLTRRRLASRITIADKSLWQTSHMNATHRPLYEDKALVTFKQADLAKDAHVDRVFNLPSGQKPYDYVFNLCGEVRPPRHKPAQSLVGRALVGFLVHRLFSSVPGARVQTRFGLSDADYQLKCVETAAKCSAAAGKMGVKKWVEVSTAQVYKPDKSASDESAPIKPWTMQATKRLVAEERVRSVAGLPWVILRPAIVYGSGDLTGFSTCAHATTHAVPMCAWC